MGIGSKTVRVIFAADDKQAQAAMKSLKREIEDFGKGVALAGAAIGAAGLAKMAYDMTSAAIASQKMTNAMVASTGSSTAAAQELAFVRAEAERLGLDLLSTVDAYTKLTAAAKGTNLEGQATRDIFSAVSGAATSLGLQAEETEGALRAIQQMMSKGTVQAEELRGQLGERLPGAFQIAARSMGVSTAELGKMLEQGKVISDDFLPKFAEELKKTFPPSEEMTHSLAAEINRLKTAYFNLNTEIGSNSGFNTGLADAVRGLTTTLQDPAFINGLTNIASVMVTMANATLKIGASAINDSLWTASLDKLKAQQVGDEARILAKAIYTPFAEVQAELAASRQMYQYSYNEINTRYGGDPNAAAKNLQLETAVYPPAPPKKTNNKTTATTGKNWLADLQLDTAKDGGMLALREKEMADLAAIEYETLKNGQDKAFELWLAGQQLKQQLWGEETDMWLLKEQGLTAITAQETEQRLQLAQIQLAGTKKFLGDLSTLQNSHSRKAFELGKAASVANAMVNTYEGVTGAYTFGAKIGGPPLGAVFGAAALAAGLANVQAIASQKFGGGGMSVGGGGGFTGQAATPVVTQPATQAPVTPANTVNVTIVGNVVDHDKFAREVIPSIQKAFADGVA